MRHEGPSTQPQAPSPERGSDRKDVWQQYIDLCKALNKKMDAIFNKAGSQLLGTDPNKIDEQIHANTPSEQGMSHFGRSFVPEHATPEDQARAKVAEAKSRLGQANNRLLKILAMTGEVALGSGLTLPAVEKAGEVQGAIDATSNQGRRGSIGRFIREATDTGTVVLNEAARDLVRTRERIAQGRQQEDRGTAH